MFTNEESVTDQSLQKYISILSKSQVETNNAIRTLTEESKFIRDSHEKSRFDIANLYENHKTFGSRPYAGKIEPLLSPL